MQGERDVRAAPIQSGIRRRPGRILIIDDERLVGRSLCLCLSDENEVLFESDAAVGLGRLLAGERFDVVLCDVMMPGIDGVEFYSRLAETMPEVASRIIFMSGGFLSERVRLFFDRVPNLLLMKPFETDALRAYIEWRMAVPTGETMAG